ncbi:MAG TPA: dephospho-CoA kinase [Candidatus Cloacimonadota bacterium]|nr:dephospho-CoA kinase [Candidatus Cloacimonadota bacterium]
MDSYYRPFLIALTGGIASGKTVVSQWFLAQNIPVFSADKIAHEVLHDPEVQDKLIASFGSEIRQNGEIDRKKLGEIVFGSPSALAKLNSLVHPEVRRRMAEIIAESDDDYLIFEIPLLFENGLQSAFDLTINIFTEQNWQIERMIKRDGISQQEAEQRIKAQMNAFDKQKLADINIANNGSISELQQRLTALWQLIKKLKKKDVTNLLTLPLLKIPQKDN